MKIVDIRLKEVQDRLSARKMSLQLDDAAKHYLASIGYSTTYGARPLNRAIQNELLNPLSVMILSDAVRDGETIRISFDGPRNRLVVIPNHEVNGIDGMDMDLDADDDIEIEEMD
jgi:ATP-dependent Clp protease ATP-binding subunit ClpB